MLNSKPKTTTQQRYLNVIRGYIAEHGYSPSQNEIAKIMSVRPNAVSEMLERLSKSRAITLSKDKSGRVRNITISEE